MSKIQRQMVDLKANVPFSIKPTGGIDCHSEIRFRVPHSAVGKSIQLNFVDADGRELHRPVTFMDVETYFFESIDVTNLNDTNFDSVELTSKEDLYLEIWTPEHKANFM